MEKVQPGTITYSIYINTIMNFFYKSKYDVDDFSTRLNLFPPDFTQTLTEPGIFLLRGCIFFDTDCDSFFLSLGFHGWRALGARLTKIDVGDQARN